MKQNLGDKLTILHTNDIHSHFELMGAAAAVISRERKSRGSDEVLVLDIGDHMDRAAAETEGTMGRANIDILNLTGYDAVTIGNNEGLTVPLDLLALAYEGLLCLVVCCNVRQTDNKKTPSWMKEHIIVVKNGIRIGITGATAPYSKFYHLLGWEAEDPVLSIEQQVQYLKDKTEIIIVMSHLGLQTDKILAERVNGIDVILGGHTHHLLEEPLMINGTAVCGAGKLGQYIGRVTLERSGPGGRFTCIEGTCIPADPNILEPVVESAILRHRIKALERLEETAAVTERELPIHYERESAFANLLAQAVRRHTGAEISIINSGQLLGHLPAGEISTGMIHALCPSPINPCAVTLKGADILQALAESLNPEISGKAIWGFGFRGKVLGVLAVDGLEVFLQTDSPGQKPYIRQVSVQGVPLDPQQDYRVGTLDMFTFKIGYESLSRGHDIDYMLSKFIRDLLRDELSRPGALEDSFLRRWLY